MEIDFFKTIDATNAGLFLLIERDLLKIGKSGPFCIVIFFSKSDKFAYITGFNRSFEKILKK